MNRARTRLALTLAGVALATAVGGLLGAAPARALLADCAEAGFTVTCTYTSAGWHEFVVPGGVSTVHVVAVGGSGGAAPAPGGAGGLGARVTGDLSVTAGETLFAVVGGNAVGESGGFNGGGSPDGFSNGGGGGASDVRTVESDLSTRLLVAGGGGGGGGHGDSGAYGGDGGIAGVAGNNGGTISGAQGGAGGGAGTATAGGAGGAGGSGDIAPGCDGNSGFLGYGGGSTCVYGGGGGGGGLYGGGGGGGGGFNGDAAQAGSGGGGGGSSLVPSGGTLATDATGVPEIAISYAAPDVVTPTALQFGSQPIGSTSPAKTVTLSDTGTSPIAVSSVAFKLGNTGDFAVSSDTCSGKSVAPGDSCTVQVTFAPTATGSRGAVLRFSDDASDSPQDVGLSGTGTTLADVKVAISGPTSALPGSQDTYSVNISNAGPSTALGVVMSAQVPNGTKFVEVATTQGSCAHPASGATSGTISCSLGDVASGAAALDSVTLKITLNGKGGSVALATQASSTASNTTPATPDPNLGNNVSVFNTTVSKK